MIISVSHIALYVSDLQAAENFYRSLFDMELIGREVEKEGGLWYTLPFDKGWDDAKTAGMEVDISSLRNGGLVLALFRRAHPTGQVFAIGLDATESEIKAIYERLSPEIVIEEFQPGRLEFVDPYHITWQIAIKPTFCTAGDFANRWIDI